MAEIQCLQLALEKLVELYKLIANNQGESIETDLIRDELYDYHNYLSADELAKVEDVAQIMYQTIKGIKE